MLPLVALLGEAHDALERAFNTRLQAAGFADVSLAHSRNVLRHLGEDGCGRASQLVERSGVSKQALSLQIAQLERAGYLETTSDPADRRARLVELTQRGAEAQRVVRDLLRDLDTEWRRQWGEEAWGLVRGRLFEVLEALP